MTVPFLMNRLETVSPLEVVMGELKGITSSSVACKPWVRLLLSAKTKNDTYDSSCFHYGRMESEYFLGNCIKVW